MDDNYQYYYRGESDIPEVIERIFVGYDTFMQRLGTLISLSEMLTVAGGACRSWALGEKPTDYDLYFSNKEDLDSWKVRYPGVKDKRVYTSSFGGFKVDYILWHFNSLPDILRGFDFTVAKCAVNANELVCHKNYIADLASRSICFDGTITHPMNSLLRLQKYIKYGFTAHPRQLENLAQAFYLLTEDPTLPKSARHPITDDFIVIYGGEKIQLTSDIPFLEYFGVKCQTM